MSKFKIGDKVRLIKDNVYMFCKGTRRQEDSPHEIGRTTTVRYVDNEGRFVMENDSSLWHYVSDWELVEETKTYLKVDDVVECINQSGKSAITNGKQYIIARYIDKTHVALFGNNWGDGGNYHERRFKLIDKLKSPKEELIKKDMEDKTIEEIKEFDNSVLKEANEEVLEEIANEQKEQAKKALRSLYDEKAVLEKDAKEKNDKIEEITNDLKGISA